MFVQKTTRDDIKTIISSLHYEDRNIRELNDELFSQLSKAIKRLVKSTPKSDQLLVETADILYNTINKIETRRPVDFGYGSTDLEIYDQALSDRLDRLSNPDFESGIMNSIKCFSNIIRTDVRASNRLKPLYLAFTFELLNNWMDKNISLFMKSRTAGIQRKIEYLLDQYVDELIVLGRKNKITTPFEGLLFVKEIKKEG